MNILPLINYSISNFAKDSDFLKDGNNFNVYATKFCFESEYHKMRAIVLSTDPDYSPMKNKLLKLMRLLCRITDKYHNEWRKKDD